MITCVALLPDGRIVSGSFDMTHRIWDPNTGECLKTLEGLPYLVSCFAVLNDGRIVSGSNDGTLCIWDPSTGERLRTLKGHSSAVSCVAVLKDGCIVSGSRDGTLRIWNPDKGECLKTLDGRSGWIAYIAVLPNGSIVSGSGAGILRIWNPDTGKCYNALRGYSYRVNCVSELPSGRIVSGLEDGTLRIWDPDKGECFKTLKGHSDRINCVGLLPKGHIISGSNDGTLRIWDPDEEKCIKTLEANSDIITCVAILPDDLIVSGSFDGALRIWDLKTEKCIKTLEGHSDVITCVALLPDGRIVSGSFDMTLRIWDPNTGECLKTLEGHSDVITCVAVLKDSRIVSGSYDGALRIWNSNTGECNNELWGYFDRITCVVSLPDGRIVSGSNDGTLCIWDPGKEQRIQFINKTLRGHSCRITCVALLPDGRIVSGSTDGTILIWDAKTYEETCVYDKVITLDERIGFVYDLTKKCINFIIYLRNNIDFFRSGKEKSKSFSNTDPEKSGYETDVHSGNKKDQEHPSFCLIDPARGGYEIDIRAEDESKQAELAKFMTEFVEKYRHTCEPEYFIDFDWGLSSGEENMLRLFSNLYHIFDSDYSSGKYGERKIYNKDLKSDDPDDPGTLCDSVLLFMDEADLTLHPEWQRRLIHVLTAFIPKIYPKSCVKDVQIVLSTHSPLLLGDIPRENICFLKGSNNAGDIAGESEETFGQNIHSILKDSFFLSNGTVGEFAASRINHIAARLGEISKFWHDSTKEQEGQASDNGDNDESKRENMRKEHEQELDVIRKTIDLVADGILRVRLESLWMEAVAALNEETETETVIELLKSSKKLSLGEKLYLLNRLSREVDK